MISNVSLLNCLACCLDELLTVLGMGGGRGEGGGGEEETEFLMRATASLGLSRHFFFLSLIFGREGSADLGISVQSQFIKYG